MIKYPENFNKSGYTLINYNYEKSEILLNIDHIYIIHLCNNGRLGNINEQLEKIKPRSISVLFNEGFKSGKKDKEIDVSYKDLVDANLFVMRDAKKKGYNNILIFEDDFVISEDFMDKDNLRSINNFINHNDYDVFYLGCVIRKIKEKINENILLIDTCWTTHAIIFSKKIIDYYTTLSFQNICYINDWDNFLVENMKKKYTFIQPLIIQPFPPTENRLTSWGNLDFRIKRWIKKPNKKSDQIVRKMVAEIIRKKLPLERVSKINNLIKLFDTTNNPRLLFDIVTKMALLRYDLFKN